VGQRKINGVEGHGEDVAEWQTCSAHDYSGFSEQREITDKLRTLATSLKTNVVIYRADGQKTTPLGLAIMPGKYHGDTPSETDRVAVQTALQKLSISPGRPTEVTKFTLDDIF